MNKCVALLLVALCVATAFADDIEKKERKCVDGKTYDDGCNNVFCTNGIVGTTLKYCEGPDGKALPQKPAPADFWEPEELKERKCIDGKKHFDGCNNCFCSNGNMACTLMLCQGPDGKTLPAIPPPADFWQS